MVSWQRHHACAFKRPQLQCNSNAEYLRERAALKSLMCRKFTLIKINKRHGSLRADAKCVMSLISDSCSLLYFFATSYIHCFNLVVLFTLMVLSQEPETILLSSNCTQSTAASWPLQAGSNYSKISPYYYQQSNEKCKISLDVFRTRCKYNWWKCCHSFLTDTTLYIL